MPISIRAISVEPDAGDEHAQQVDLDHRPGPQPFLPREQAADEGRRAAQVERQQHRDHGERARQGGGEGGDQDDGREGPHAALFQVVRPGEQVGEVGLAGGADRQQRHAGAEAQQQEGGEVKRQRQAERVSRGVAQHGVAAQAHGAGGGRQGRQHLQLAAIVALPQARRGDGGVGGDGACGVGQGGHQARRTALGEWCMEAVGSALRCRGKPQGS